MSPTATMPRTIPFPATRETRKTSFVGMVMALASWTMLFASLFFAYAILRFQAPAWPPEGVSPLPRLVPGLNTLLLLLSSAVLHLGIRPGPERTSRRLLGTLRLTVGLGTLFLALQLLVWVTLWREGFRIDAGPYGSIFYGLTVFHALHVLAGLVALLVLVPGARAGRHVSAEQDAVRLSAMFWHFVDVVWLVMFVAVYMV